MMDGKNFRPYKRDGKCFCVYVLIVIQLHKDQSSPFTQITSRCLVIFLFVKGREDMTRRNKQRRKKQHRGAPPNFSGQHFMHNKKLINDIVDLAKIKKDDFVIDLGAGKGALTSVLSQKAGKVLAVEYDRQLVDILQKQFKSDPKTMIVQQDILQINFPSHPFVVVANIPFSITTPIMKRLLNNPSNGFRRGVIVMEKGAARRFTAGYVKDPYIIVWRMWFDMRYVKTISRNFFAPPPSVDSAVITIKRKSKPIVPLNDLPTFWGLVQYVMQAPQLPIDIALRNVFTVPQIKHLKRNLRMKNVLPVGALTEQHWAIIFETMAKHVPSYRWPKRKRSKRRYS